MTHAMVSRFESASEGHTDPGSGYPLAHVLAIANGYVKAGGWAPPGADPTPTPTPPARAARPAGAVIHYTDKHGKRQTQTLSHPILWQNKHTHVWWHGPLTIVPQHKK
jgi:hypothetical protein